ncbi:MAG: bifunctional phosphoribosylaminoimidazolecarboxamide formyltransferase/IMP cyclohydrolase, partial [Solirubrobacterales bacterium]|nr:bifunctional phosphoribosylaminoimidazolecarboxamide formyltransferase/IMP cyclohydrolase [Solirubrobacterales bacterium]
SYDAVLAELDAGDGEISEETRHWLANEAFAEVALYDAAISRWFGLRYEAFPQYWVFAYEKFLEVSYGENPHQRGALYVESGARSHVLARVSKLHGKALSFNNVLDLDSASKLLAEFDEPAAVIVKHNNPCGVAIADSVEAAYEKALACDPLSAYGGVIALNRPVEPALAEQLAANFIEVLVAPEFS